MSTQRVSLPVSIRQVFNLSINQDMQGGTDATAVAQLSGHTKLKPDYIASVVFNCERLYQPRPYNC